MEGDKKKGVLDYYGMDLMDGIIVDDCLFGIGGVPNLWQGSMATEKAAHVSTYRRRGTNFTNVLVTESSDLIVPNGDFEVSTQPMYRCSRRERHTFIPQQKGPRLLVDQIQEWPRLEAPDLLLWP